MKLEKLNKIQELSLKWGVVLLAVSIPFFSHTIMYFAFGFLVISFAVLAINGAVQFKPTGLEVPLAVFIFLYLAETALSGAGVKHVVDNYWHVLYMFAVIYLFNEKEMTRFLRVLKWSAFIICVITILQSLVGLTFNLEFTVGSWARMSQPSLEKFAKIGDHVIYRGRGVVGRWHYFVAQLLMLLFFLAATFRKKWAAGFALLALILTFYYPAWFAAALGYALFFIIRKRYYVISALIAAVSVSLFAFLGGFEYFHYENSILADFTSRPSAVIVLAAFLYFVYKFIKLYGGTVYSTREHWQKFLNYSWCALGAVTIFSFFKNSFTNMGNSIFIWTIAGLIVKVRISKWSRRLMMLKEE